MNWMDTILHNLFPLHVETRQKRIVETSELTQERKRNTESANHLTNLMKILADESVGKKISKGFER